MENQRQITSSDFQKILGGYNHNAVFQFSNREITGDIIISEFQVDLKNCKAKKLTLEHCRGNVKLADCEFDEVKVVNNIGISNFYFKGKIINNLEFDSSPESITIKESTIGSIKLPSTRASKKIQIQGLNVKQISVSQINQNLTLNDVVIEESLTLSHCAFDDSVIFQYVNLFDASLVMSSSSITRAQFHSIRWMKDYKITPERYGDFNSYNFVGWNTQETYRQLKVIALGLENKIDAKHFLTNELGAYYKFLKSKTFGKPRLKLITVLKSVTRKDFYSYFTKWILLGTNKWFSNFGDSYIRPICWLVSVHFLFVWLGFDLFGAKINWLNADWNTTWKTIGLYLKSISPIHDYELKDINGKLLPQNLTADFFMRVFSGYFIYYFLKATRQYNFSV